MKEQERKFLLLSMPKTECKLEIKQGYLMFEDNKQLRIRIIDNVKAFLAFKIFHRSV